MITKDQIHKAQKKWGDGIVKIGSLMNDEQACIKFTNSFLNSIYDFKNSDVLFKPTKVNKEQFRPKIEIFFENIVKYCNYLTQYSFKIITNNTFPHSSGIASSASGMSALALCVMSLEKELDPKMDNDYFYKNKFHQHLQ